MQRHIGTHKIAAIRRRKNQLIKDLEMREMRKQWTRALRIFMTIFHMFKKLENRMNVVTQKIFKNQISKAEKNNTQILLNNSRWNLDLIRQYRKKQ